MNKIFLISIVTSFHLFTLSACGQEMNDKKNDKTMNTEKYTHSKSEEEWKKILTPEQYYILRDKGTERPFTGKYWNSKEKGVYCCAGCGTELFTSEQKFESECGWPSFDEELGKGEKILKKSDYTHGMVRTEIVCASCGGHLGHIFDDGPTATGKRYCVNSVSINLIKK